MPTACELSSGPERDMSVTCNLGVWWSYSRDAAHDVADLLTLNSTQLFGGKCVLFLKKIEMIMEENEKLGLLLKDKTGNFQGISSFLGATLVVLSESQCALPRLLGGCFWDLLVRPTAWHVAGPQERVAVMFPPVVMGGRV